VVSNIVQTIESIQHAITAEATTRESRSNEVVVGIAGQHIRSLQHSDYITRDNPDEVIGDKDIKDLIDNVHKLVMLPGEEIIHVLPQEYKVDGQAEIKEPRGMYGGRLEANFHIVVGQVSAIRNIGRCVKNAELEVGGITLEPLASADAVLEREEKEAGVVLVDIGGGTTDVAIFKDGIIRHTAVIPFGGNVITEDIKEGCSIIEKQAEQLKIKFGSAWPGENKENEIVSIPGLRGREPKEISSEEPIAHHSCARGGDSGAGTSRNQELRLRRPQEEIHRWESFLTGGGAQFKHIKQLVEYVTGMDTRIGYPE
jgi:cell division protein FtsA